MAFSPPSSESSVAISPPSSESSVAFSPPSLESGLILRALAAGVMEFCFSSHLCQLWLISD